jgi:pseudaminic acid cytidylyltransferase
MRRVAVIPARGGSKRIPRKNIRVFNGKPVIAYAILAAQSLKLFDVIAVSTEDEEIQFIAETFGAAIVVRPHELADDYTPTVPVVAHAIAALESASGPVDQVCCVYPATPLLRPSDLSAGLDLLARAQTGYVFPVTTFAAPVQRALKLDENGQTTPFDPQYALTRSQDLEPAYFDAGQFYWGHRQSWVSQLPIHKNATGLVLPHWRVVDIDTVEDWRRAEILAEAISRFDEG